MRHKFLSNVDRGRLSQRWRQHRGELLEPRHLLAASVVISEFMASNDTGIRDEDHDRSDWIELRLTTIATLGRILRIAGNICVAAILFICHL